MTEINSRFDLPADGMVVVKPWDGKRRQGWHIERVTGWWDDELVRVDATPVNISTGETTGETRNILLRFGLDIIEVMR